MFGVGSRKILGAVAHAAMESARLVDVVEAKGGGIEPAVPFSEVAGAIAVLLEGIGEGEVVEVEVGTEEGFLKFVVFSGSRNGSGGDMGVAHLGRVLAGNDASAGGGAGGCWGVGLGEVHAPSGELDEVGCFVGAGLAKVVEFFNVLPAEVIDVEDNDIGFGGESDAGAEREGRDEEKF